MPLETLETRVVQALGTTVNMSREGAAGWRGNNNKLELAAANEGLKGKSRRQWRGMHPAQMRDNETMMSHDGPGRQ